MKVQQVFAFEYSELEKLVKELYGQEIDILHEMIPDERIGHYTYHKFTVNGQDELDCVGDDEIVRVWTETGQLTNIDMRNDPEWSPFWSQYYLGNVEVKHILNRLFLEGHIQAGEYIMLVDW